MQRRVENPHLYKGFPLFEGDFRETEFPCSLGGFPKVGKNAWYGWRSVLGVSVRDPESPRSLRQLTECPWRLSTLSGTARAIRSVLGVSVGPGDSRESPGLPECPWSLFEPPGGARGRLRAKKKCPRSVRAARRLLGVSGAHGVSLETP